MLRLTILGTLTVALAAAAMGCGQNAGPPPVGEPKRDKPTHDVAAATPEQALRTFLIAMTTKDEATLRAVTLPTEDFDWLLRGQVAAADQVDRIKAEIARMPIRALQPGDELTFPGGRRLTVQPKAVAADKAMLVMEGSPLPYGIQKVDGGWHVDAGPIIAARKRTDPARKERQPN
jgi:hypothetical protein